MFWESNLFFLSSLSRIISLAVNKYEVKDKQFSVFSPVMNSNILAVEACNVVTIRAKTLNWNLLYFRSVSKYFIFKHYIVRSLTHQRSGSIRKEKCPNFLGATLVT